MPERERGSDRLQSVQPLQSQMPQASPSQSSEVKSKRFQCLHPGCGKTFNRKDYLARHAVNHLEVRPYQCPICPSQFARQDLLEKHMSTKAHEKRQKREMALGRLNSGVEILPHLADLPISHNLPQMAPVLPPLNPQLQQMQDLRPAPPAKLLYDHPDLYKPKPEPEPDRIPSTYMSFNNSTIAPTQEWPAFSLDSFDLSLSDHYTWLFGSDFWTQSPPEDLMSTTNSSTSDWPVQSNTLFQDQFAFAQDVGKPGQTIEAAVTETFERAPFYQKNSNIRNSPPIGRPESRPSEKRDDKDINEEAYAKMLEVLAPISEITPDNPYFSLGAMKQYLNLYWVHFDTLYPILHRTTFDPSVMEPALLIAIVTIGMAYSSDREASTLAIVIHRKFRNIVFLMIEDQPQVQLWVHQTLLLTNYFDKMLGSTVQYDMSQFFHGTNIALMHFSGSLKGLSEPPVVHTTESVFADQQWMRWVEYETTKRTAFFAFICDTQHATLFRHSPILSAFEVRLELPSTDACWTATDGIEFLRKYEAQCKLAQDNKAKRNAAAMPNSDQVGPMIGGSKEDTLWPSFLHSLKRLIRLSGEDQQEFQLATFSQLSCLILLHGLLSICWDMQWRGLLDMGIVSKRRMNEFKSRLESSFANWKAYFDYQLSKSNLPSITSTVMIESSPANSPSIKTNDMNDFNNSPMLCSNWAMFQLGLLSLHVDTMNLRINAGSPNVLGRKIRAVDRENSNKAVHSWARSEDGRLATWHSVNFMRRIAENESLLDQAVHIPWGVYLATLTIWSYELCQADDSVPLVGSSLPRNNKKYMTRGQFALAKQDALQYLRSMDEMGEGDSGAHDSGAMRAAVAARGARRTDANPGNQEDEAGDRKQLVIGLLAYSCLLLMPIKWGFVVRGCEVLSNILKEYD